jgi:hypothetical protein
MNTGQTMLTIGALVLLGLTVFSVNSNTLQHGVILNQTEIGVYAVSLATSYIQKASGMNFDEKTILSGITGGTAASTTNLTAYSALGIEPVAVTGEPFETANMDTTFDDFDDFNKFSKSETIPGVDMFTTTAKVYYINPASPDAQINGPTFFKRMDVKTFGTVGRGVFQDTGATAASKGIDTVKLSYIFSYIN